MNEQDYKRNLSILKATADELREENQKLASENLTLTSQLNQFRKNMLSIETASKTLERTYRDTVSAYESELDHQAEVNKALHHDVRKVQESLQTFQGSFIGKLVMFFVKARSR